MTRNTVILFLSFLLFFLACCNGQLVLYFRATENKTACPPNSGPSNCTLLSEYVANQSVLLDPNTTFVFLPGLHVLDAPFSISMHSGVTVLRLQPQDLERKASITCEFNGYFNFRDFQLLEIVSLEFSSCGFSEFLSQSMFFIDRVTDVTIKYCNFTNNSAAAAHVSESELTFIGNRVTFNLGYWMFLDRCTAKVIDTVAVGNSQVTQTAGLSAYMSFLTISGTTIFNENSGVFGGAVYGFNSTVVLEGTTTFTNNFGTIGGVLVGAGTRLFLRGNAYFEGNSADFGGVFGFLNSQITISGGAEFISNDASYGGTVYSVSSTLTFLNEGNVTFVRNSAANGGAMFLTSGSSVNFLTNSPGSLTFEENFASLRGGAVFIQDTNTLSYCLSSSRQNIAVQECSFQVADYDGTATYQERMYFLGNYAEQAGSAIYGGAIDICILNTFNDADIFAGGELFNQLTFIGSSEEGIDERSVNPSTISSDAFIVCPCDGNEPICGNVSIFHTVYPGASLQVTVVALGQRNGTVPATVLVLATGLAIEELENTQGISNECNNLSYTIYAEPGNSSLDLYTEGACLTQGIGLTIDIEVLSCAPGFVMTAIAKGKVACTCDTRLTRYTDTCNPQDGTILRDDTFWVGYDQELDGIILYSTCPFDYCITDDMSFRVEDSNSQCNHNRVGLLCGECPEGLSLLLGSTRCEKCSNSYLALLLFFAAAGLILVAFLLLLNLTVADGTINGLVFYANIVAANETLFFPSDSNTYLDLLKVFIAWINLDFGIESCFYDGMDAYAKTWLQYVFPLYIWALIGLVFVVAHFSPRASKMLGSNPVAVLATLLLLSYAKVLRTIIESFSSATLDYPQGESRLVWLYDGNVPFLDASDGRHTGLFVASFLVLLLLFIPYTLLLLTSQWLQIKSHWKVLSWLNKPQLRSFLDAYHAPYKPKHRYWTGLLLLVRFALLLTSARNSFTNPSVNFLVIQIFVLLVQMWAWINGGIYNKWYLNVLEAFFFLNLGLLAASTHHIKFEFATMELSSNETQMSIAATSSTLITAAVVAFIGIVSFHIYLKIPGNEQIAKYFVAKVPTAPPNMELEDPAKSSEEVTTTYVSFREPMLDDC